MSIKISEGKPKGRRPFLDPYLETSENTSVECIVCQLDAYQIKENSMARDRRALASTPELPFIPVGYRYLVESQWNYPLCLL